MRYDKIEVRTTEERAPEHILYDVISQLAGRDFIEPNLVEVISLYCGWYHFMVNEKGLFTLMIKNMK